MIFSSPKFEIAKTQIMLPDNINPLPKWKERLVIDEEDGASWKWKEDLALAEITYNHWRELFPLVMAFAESLPEKEDEHLSTQQLIYENLFMVAPKIMSAAGDTLYQIKMENAAIIRYNCRQMWEQIAFAVLTRKADKSYKLAIEDALDKFKSSFRNWVSTFKKDEAEDEWGLF